MDRGRTAAFWKSGLASDAAGREHELRTAARAMIAARKALQNEIPISYLHDPSLAMLLALFVANGELSMVEVVASTTVRPITAERWLEVLQADELVILSDLGADKEGIVRLTRSGHTMVAQAVAAVIEAQLDLHVRDLH